MDVPELTPMDDYDPQKAQLKSSVLWLLCKAYGNNIPAELSSPFYENPRGDLCLKPVVITGLASSDVYCKACANIFTDTSGHFKGHMSVMQQLSRKGIYVVDVNESDITENVLMQTSPFKYSAHLALMTSLMTAYTCEVVTTERIVQAVRRFASFNASSELPYDVEDALMFWMNKVCGTIRQQLERDFRGRPPDGQPKDPNGESNFPEIPVMDDLLKDVNDGCCLGAVISFYSPDIIRVTDVALSLSAGIADSLYNLQLVLDFCDVHLPIKCSHLDLNDMFYTHEDLKAPILALLADLFFWFEVQPAPCVRDLSKPYQIHIEHGDDTDDSRPSTAKQLQCAGRPPLPISNATKRSFHQNPLSSPTHAFSSTPDLTSPGASLPPPRQPLLPKRLNQRNAIHGEGDIPRKDEREMRQSMRAWEESGDGNPHGNPTGNPHIPSAKHTNEEPYRSTQSSRLTNVTPTQDSQRSGSTLLSNVSIDTEMSLDFTTDSSIDISAEIDTSPSHYNKRSRPVSASSRVNQNDMELESISSSRVTSANTARTTARGNPHTDMEPLMPAKLKPAKEKSSNHTKEVESGEKVTKKSPSSPVKPRNLSFKSTVQRQDSSGSSTDEEYATPSVESMPLPGEKEDKSHTPVPSQVTGQPQKTRNKQFEAFYVDTEAPSINGPPSSRPVPSALTSAVSTKPAQQSFTLHEQSLTRDQARAAGIPVIDGSRSYNSPPRASTQRREEQDQELRKINADHRDRETKEQSGMSNSFYLNQEAESSGIGQRPDSLNVVSKFNMDSSGSSTKSDDRPSPKTSFAQIKKQKDNGEVSPILYMQKSTPQKGALKSVSNTSGSQPKSAKKTSFAALPNQTTWQESAQKKVQDSDSNRSSGSTDTVQPLPSELHHIRMRLEERRRQIETEKRRMEVQWNKQRQRVGKQAFIQVISKGKSEESSPTEGEPDMVTSSGQGTSQEMTDSQNAAIEEQRRRAEQAKEAERKREADRIREEKARQEAEEKARQEAEEKARREAKEKMKQAQKAHEEERAKQMQRAKQIEKQREPQKGRDAIKAKEEQKQQEADKIREAERDLEVQREKLRKLLEEKEQDLQDLRAENISETENMKPKSDRTRNRNSESDDDKKERSQRSFSREDIQETIDNVKNRWFSSGENSLERKKKNRPMSYAGRDEQAQQPQVMSLSDHSNNQERRRTPPKSTDDMTSSTGSTGSQQGGGDYVTSFDKLNNSLSELQGEIMKLSVQQDQIKKDRAVRMSTPPGSARSVVSPPREYYGQPIGEPDLAQGTRDYTSGISSVPSTLPSHSTSHMTTQHGHLVSQAGQMVTQQGAPPGTSMYAPGQPTIPYQAAPAPMFGVQQPAYIPGQYPNPYMPGQPQAVQTSQGPIGPFPMAFPGSPALYQQQIYGAALSQSGGFANQSQWQSPPHMQYGTPVTTSPAHVTLPVNQHMASTNTVTAHNTLLQSPTASVPSHELYNPHPDIMTSSNPLSTSGSSLPSPRPLSHGRGSPDIYSNGHSSPPPEITSVISSPGSGPSWLNRAAGEVPLDNSMSASEGEPESSHSSSPPPPPQPAGAPKGFFIAFEESSPKRQKPKLKSAKEKAKEVCTPPVPPPITAKVDSPSEKKTVAPPAEPEVATPPRAVSPPRPPIEVSPGVGFVIDVDNQELTEFEKKKRQKMVAMELKRKEESEKKRRKLEADKQKKREHQQQKKDEAEAKKADEKARREAIFQQYQQRKAEQAIVEEESKAGISVPRRQKPKPKSARPKSQPPGHPANHPANHPAASHSDRNSSSSHSHGSQEDLFSKGSGNSVPYSNVNPEQMDSGFPLAYGGLTHRRPPSPGIHSLSTHSSPRGPKLFVKPSQKSNRNIIQNAISHCCLAGTVNNDVKNRVLEDINSSEAKHFLILFRNAGMMYRALYRYNPETEEVHKIHGNGPKQLESKMMERFYKYNSGGKSFSEITSTKHLSVSIDAIVIYNHYWQKKKAAPFSHH